MRALYNTNKRFIQLLIILLTVSFNFINAQTVGFFPANSAICDISQINQDRSAGDGIWGGGPSTLHQGPSSRFALSISPARITPGQEHTITLTRNQGSGGFRGLLLYVADGSNNRVGTFTISNGAQMQTLPTAVTGTGCSNHSSILTHTLTSAFAATQNFTWTAPASLSGPVTISAIAFEHSSGSPGMYNVPTPLTATLDDPVNVTSIVRQTPTDATTDADQVVFRVTFDRGVQNVDVTDFSLSGTAAGDGTVSNVSAVSQSVYDVTITGVTNSAGTINLDIKGNGGVTGTNNIIGDPLALDQNQTATPNTINRSEFGQSFTANNTGALSSVSIFVAEGGISTYTGTATMELRSGDGLSGAILATETINITGGTGFQNFTFSTPANVSAGQQYTVRFTGPGNFSSDFIVRASTGDPLSGGVIYQPTVLATADLAIKIFVDNGKMGLLSSTAPGTDETYTIQNNLAPTATNVSITGTFKSGQQLTGSYTWADADNGDTESGTTFKWYRSDDAAGTGKVAIAGANTVNYTLTNSDINKFISFEVTPNDGTTAGTPVESARALVANVFITSIARQTPADATTKADEVTFRVIFSAGVARLSKDDFVLSGTVAGDGTVSSIIRVNGSTYDVKVTGIDISEGTINLDLKGADGAGTNNIIKANETQDATNNGNLVQDSGGDTFFWQSFVAEQTGLFHSVTLRKSQHSHTYEGTATLKLYAGEGTGGAELASQQIFTSQSSGDETYYFELPASITQGSIYTWFWQAGTGTGATGFSGQTGNLYGGGRGLSEQFPTATSLDWYFITQTITGALESLGSPAPSTDEIYTIVNPPEANNVAIAGTGAIGQQLTGSYTYNDPQSNAESGTTFRWLRANDTNGTGKTAIGSATSTTYTVQAADAGKFLIFEVTASDGTKTGDPTESTAKQIQQPLSVQSIARQTPTTANITAATDPVFRVTFSENADNVTVDDFVLNTTAGGTISSINGVDGKTYDLTVNNLNNVDGTLGLKVKGIDGATGTNDISTSEFANGAVTHQQSTQNDFLNQALIGQSFTAASNNFLTAFTLFAKSGTHTFSGTARLRILEGDASNSTVLNDANAVLTTETVNVSSNTAAAGQTFNITNPPQLTSGTAYSIVLDIFTGSGDRAFFAHTSGSLAGGRAFFTGSHNGHAAFDFMIDIFENAKVVKNLFDKAPTTNETYTVAQDLVKPTVSITSDASNPQNGAFTATFTFSEDVTGFAVDDITVGNGAASHFQTTSAKVYTATITPTATGTVTIDVAADKAQDLVGNNNTAATQLTVTNDETKPTVTITASANPSSGAFTATFTFSEDVTGFVVGDITVGNGAASNFNTTSAKVYTATITPAADGATTVDVAADKAQDAAGNGNTVATQLSVTNDETRPTVTITSTNTTGFALGEFPVTITFSESVTGFVEGDLTLSNGTVKTGTFSGSGTTYTATIEGTNHGTVTVDVAADKANDAAGNGNTSATQFSIENDVISPSVTITSNATNPQSGAFTATFTFDEDVTGFTVADIDVGNGAASGFSATSAKVYTATITPAADGAVTVDIAFSKATDIAGNHNNAATQLSVNNDETKPTIIITSSTNPTSGAFTATFTFSEDVTGFVVGDITVGNGALSNFNATSAKVYTATITPAADGAVTLDVSADKASDAAGNGNTAATQLSVTNDETKPTVTITSTNTSGAALGEFPVIITFNESVTGFMEGDITLSNGTVKTGTFSGSGTTYTATIEGTKQGTVTVDVAADKANDAAGNGNTAATQFSIENDVISPSVTITSDAANPQSGAFTATFTFDEDVTGFTLSDLTVGNGAASNFNTTSAKVYTATITPTADGQVTVDVPALAATDIAGNFSNAATQHVVVNDETRPTVTITSSTNPTSGAFTATFTFSEDVTGFVAGDITVGNGAASNFNATSATVYTATITPAADGTVTVDVAADKAQDAAGNNNTAATQLSVTNDETKPIVTITSNANNPQSGAFTATFTFSEDVTGFVVGDVTVGNGAASNFNVTSAKVYTATITPTADGAVTIDVAADKANDAAGNGNTAATQLSVTNDETKPTVTITASADPTSGAFTATFTFSEDVTGFEVGDITAGNGAVSNFNATSAKVYTAIITPTADGAVTIDVAADKANDAAGNGNTVATQLSVTNDETNPTVTLSASTTNPVNGKFAITAQFSETVTGFVEADITITGGTISDYNAVDGDTYTFSVSSPGASATVSVAADKASDATGNMNTASNSLALTFDITPPDAPTIDLASSSDSGSSTTDDLTNDTTPNIVGTAEANSTVEIFDGGTSVGTTNADGSGNWSLAPNSALAEGSHSVTAKATDAAGNTSVASTVLTVTIDTTSPLIPSIDGISDDNGTANFDFMTNDNTLVFNGTAEANASVEVFIDGTSIGSVSTTNSGDFSFDHTGTTLSDNSYTVTAKATDAAGNTSESSTASTLVIDTSLPTPTLSVTGSSLTNTSFPVTFEYDEIVTGFELNDISVTNGTASNFTSITAGRKWTADITPSADGTVSVSLAAGVATDTPGNSSAIGNTVSKTFDGTAPTVVSINRKGSDGLNTSTTFADFRVIYSEDVSGVDVTDFETVTTGSATGAVNSVSQVDAKTYDVTVNSISGEGTIGLNAKDDNSVTDNAGNSQNGTFAGQVYTTNFAPTAIELSPNNISENNEVGATVGALSSTDADGSDTHSYSLVSGTGDADNGSFTIDGSNLKTQMSFDFETKSSYSIRVKSQDSNGGSFEQSLTITIDNVLEPSVTITGEVSFPTSALGLSQQLPLTITNNGEISVEVRAVSTPRGFSVLPGAFVLAVGESREVSVTFVPTEVRVYSGNITFSYGEFVVSHPVSGEGAIITSVDDNLIDADEISLYPNPTATELNIDLSQLNGKELDIIMRNVSGVAVYEQKSYSKNRLSLNVQHFKSGLYIMQFSDGKSVIRKKVMIKK